MHAVAGDVWYVRSSEAKTYLLGFWCVLAPQKLDSHASSNDGETSMSSDEEIALRCVVYEYPDYRLPQNICPCPPFGVSGVANLMSAICASADGLSDIDEIMLDIGFMLDVAP